MKKELSKDFRKLANTYFDTYGKSDSWKTHGKLEIIYTYHEYAISAYFNCLELYERYFSETQNIEYTNDPLWIMAENDYHTAIFGLYTNWVVVLDTLQNINNCIRSSDNNIIKVNLEKVSKKFVADVKNFKDIRNNVTAHPFEEWEWKNTRYLTPVSRKWSSWWVPTITFRMFDLDKKDFSEIIILNPYMDLLKLNEYMQELLPVYQSFLLP